MPYIMNPYGNPEPLVYDLMSHHPLPVHPNSSIFKEAPTNNTFIPPYNLAPPYNSYKQPEFVRHQTSNVMNVTSQVIPLLNIKIYTTSEDTDIDITLQQNQKYTVEYVTENGYSIATGYLIAFKAAASFEVTDYIRSNQNDIHFIRLDCSKEGQSIITDIMIQNIRNIYLGDPKESEVDEKPEDDPTYVDPSTEPVDENNKEESTTEDLKESETASDQSPIDNPSIDQTSDDIVVDENSNKEE